jgi:pimeloyl-ACP methyl ester carboxylesterase
MKRTQPPWLDKNLFPFESKWIDIDNELIHYIDEGSGPLLLMVHGTPEWSFGYRDLIKELRTSFRCIAIDLLGFGLSDKNPHSDYSCKAHSDRLEQFIEKLQLRDITIIANDFGGGISLPYAIDHPKNIRSLILFNTWMWSLKNDKHYSGPAKVMNSWFGLVMYLIFNFPVNVIMPSAFGNKKLLTREIHRHYKNALPEGNRTAAYTFAKELMNASDWWESYWQRINTLKDKPFLFFWGMKDKFVPGKELEKWKSKLPEAKVVKYEDAGHFVQEEKAGEMAGEIREFLNAGLK